MEVPQKAIGVFTSGGDAPGMNAALRAIVAAAKARGLPVFAIYEGYQGMIEGAPCIRQLTWEEIKPRIHEGGTLIGTARSTEFRKPEGRRKAVLNLLKHGIDSLICIGGDGSLTGAKILLDEWSGHLEALQKDGLISSAVAQAYGALAVAGLVGSIDNDMCGTDLTIGCNTALERIVFAIDCLTSTAASHQRVFVLEVMGRNCGWLALMAGVITGADWVFFPEEPPKDGWEENLCQKLSKIRAEGRRMSIIIVSEGAITRNGKHLGSEAVRALIEKRTGFETRVTVLGHMQRGGDATVLDRLVSTLTGAEAVRAVLDPSARSTPQMVGMRGAAVVTSPLMACVKDTQEVPKAIAAGNFARAIELRGTDFAEAVVINRQLARRSPPGGLPAHRLRIAVLSVGASSPGMNSAARVAVRTALSAGHIPLLVTGGWPGLRRGDIEEASWASVSSWGQAGGAFLAPSRNVPPSDSEWDGICQALLRARIDALLMVGGFEGYVGMHRLSVFKARYPELARLSLLALPATISNNCPATEDSIGANRALTNLVEAADKILESGGGAKRAYVMEVMGNYCGYLAFMGGIAAGADQIYLHEQPPDVYSVMDDYKTLDRRFAVKAKPIPALFVTNEKASDLLDTSFVVKLFSRGDEKFQTRSSVLGHLQQGGAPSAADRILATRLAYNAVMALAGGKPLACMVGIYSGAVTFTPLEAFPASVDLELRRPLRQAWLQHLPLYRALAAPPYVEPTTTDRSKL